MTQKVRVLDFIKKFPGRDDDEIAAVLQIKQRQSVNQVCRSLVHAGLIERRKNAQGKLSNFALSTLVPPVKTVLEATSCDRLSIPSDWYWEGNVVDALANHLVDEGWCIKSQADTANRERGFDLHVECGDRKLFIEAKGYPSTEYRDPARAGQRKPTSPSLQAQHWFAHALLKGVRMQAECKDATVALAFPDFPRYRSLLSETRLAFTKLELGVFLVDESGAVEVYNPAKFLARD